ncbi:hypothetical protein HK104_008657 [Borealophlyctis nickersoniae]|nr:hypothetical protein HK104_008657 [Borealophlyctis nickersoniae]
MLIRSASGAASSFGNSGGNSSGNSNANNGASNLYNSKAYKLVTSGKEEVTKEGLANLLLNRPLTSVYYDEAMQWLDPHGDPELSLTDTDLRRIAMLVSGDGRIHKGDVKAMLARFDKDGDGVIGLEDFKKMALHE